MTFSAALGVAHPELILAIGALVLLVWGAFAPKAHAAIGWASVVLLLAALVVLGALSLLSRSRSKHVI